MFYKVRARIIPEKMSELFEKLTDGTIQNQRPDGPEIVASMRRARLVGELVTEWSETCYCSTPLDHERSTVYDHFFTEIETEEISEEPKIKGVPLWGYLEVCSR